MNKLRFFFRSKQFKTALSVTLIVILLACLSGILGGTMSTQTSLLGAVVAPFQKLGSSIVNTVRDIGANFKTATVLNAENDKLKNEINELREQLVDYQSALTDNEFYKEYLEIKDANPDFKFSPAFVTAKDPDDLYGGFTVDAGSFDGIALYDPVITDEGLVGFVTELGIATSKVTTILSPDLICGAYDSRTNDAGALAGDASLATSGKTKFYNLPRTCSVAVGDIIVTSGSGVFPDKIIIGTIDNIKNDALTSSLFATITPAVDFSDLRSVMIITDFTGQGNQLIDEE